MNHYRQQLWEHTSSAGLFPQPPRLDFTLPPAPIAGRTLPVLKTHTRRIVTLAIGEFIARETVWWDPLTERRYPSQALRRLVAPGSNFGYDVVVYVGRALFLEALPVRQVIAQLAQRHVHLSASTVGALGRRFVALLALAHYQCAPQIKAAMILRGGYILHLDATYEDQSPLLMTGVDAVLEIVLGNIKLPSEKAAGIVPFLRHLKACFGNPLAAVHDMSHGIIAAIEEVFPGIPDYICHFHFLRDLGKDLFGAEYDTLRKGLQRHGTVSRLYARLRAWQVQIDIHPKLRPGLAHLPEEGLAGIPLPQAPLVTAYLLGHWILAGRQLGQGYGFPFDRPLLAVARRAQEVYAQLPALQSRSLTGEWRDNLPFHHLGQDLQALIQDRPLKTTLNQLETKIQVFDQLRQIMRIAPLTARQGLNHAGETIDLSTLRQHLRTFDTRVRARPDYPTTPAFAKMLAQIKKYEPKLLAAPLVVETPHGPQSIQLQRTNNMMERRFRDLKRGCRRKTGNQALGRTLRTMLADTPLVGNLRNPEYLKILLQGQPDLEARFAQIEPTTVREELRKAQQNPEKVPATVKRFVAQLPTSTPVKVLFEKLQSNRISGP